jgi:hypothetical protein
VLGGSEEVTDSFGVDDWAQKNKIHKLFFDVNGWAQKNKIHKLFLMWMIGLRRTKFTDFQTTTYMCLVWFF